MAEIFHEQAGAIGRSGMSAPDRLALRRLLAVPEAIHAVLDEVELTPREEVVHEAAEIIASCIDAHAGAIELVAQSRLRRGFFARITIARALGYARALRTRTERREVLLQLLCDPEAGVRDAAATGLENLGDGSVVARLQAALANESVELVRASIEDAIAALR